MQIKKIAAAIATGVMVAGTVVPNATFAAQYSEEQEAVYNWAKGVVTSAQTIDSARMNDKVLRYEAAIMLVKFVESTQTREADTSADCTFDDISGLGNSDREIVIKACQYGVMGQNTRKNGVNNFRPYTNISRAEFGTALSRVLWGSTYNTDGSQFWINHLAQLNAAGVMSDITNAQRDIIRWHAMKLLKSASGVETVKEKDECDKVATQIICQQEKGRGTYDMCPKACQEKIDEKDECKDGYEMKNGKCVKEEVKSGKLIVDVEGNGSTKDVPTVGTVVMDSVNFSASDDVTVRSVTLETEGLTNSSAIENIRFEKNGVKVGTEKGLNTKGVAVVSLGKGIEVKKGETLDLVVDLSGSAGSKVSFKITDVDSTAEKMSISADTTVVCTLVKYGVAQTEFVGGTGNYTHKLGTSSDFEIGTFKIKNKTADGEDKRSTTVKSITLTNNGTAKNLDYLSDIVVTRDGKEVSEEVTTDNDKMIIVLNDEIAGGVTAEYIIRASIDNVDRNGDTYTFVLDEETDLVVDETKSGFRSSIVTVNPKTVSNVTVNGGKIKLSDTSAKSIDASVDGQAMIAEGVVTTTTPFTVKKNGNALTITVTNGYTGIDLKDPGYVSINGNNSDLVAPNANSTANSGELYIKNAINFDKGENTVQVYINMSENTGAQGMNVTFAPITSSSFGSESTYDMDSTVKFTTADEMYGSIALSTINVKGAKYTLTRTSSSEDYKYVKGKTGKYTIFEGELKNARTDTIAFKSLGITGGTVLEGKDSIEFELYVNDESIESVTMNDKNYNFAEIKGFSSISLKAGDVKRIKLVATVDITTGVDRKYSFEIAANGENTSVDARTPVSSTTETTSSIKVVESGNASITTSNANVKSTNTYSRNEAGVKLAEWKVTVKNENLTLKAMTISGSSIATGAIGNVTVSYKGASEGSFTSEKSGKSADGITFEDLNETLEEGVYTFIATANIESKVAANSTINFNGVSMSFDGIAATTGTINFKNTIVAVRPKVGTPAIAGDKMTFGIQNPDSANSDYKLVVTGFTLADNSSLTGMTVKISAEGETLYTGEVAGATNLAITKEIPAGQTVMFTIEIVKASDGNTIKLNMNGIGYEVEDTETHTTESSSLTEDDLSDNNSSNPYVISYKN